MRKIILHCGMPKTGSSALQVQLAQSREILLAHGYDYLPIGAFAEGADGRIASGNGVALARAYLGPDHPVARPADRAALTEALRETLRQCDHHVILSSEYFAATPRPLLVELATALADLGEVQLVFFVREQLNALTSAYIQQVKRHGETRYPDAYFADWTIHQAPLMMYNAYFNRLRTLAPELPLIVRPYEQSHQHPAGLLGLFLELIGAGLPPEALPENSHINLSPNPQEIRLLLEANRHRPRMQFSDMLVEASQRAGRSQINAQHAIIPPAIAARIRSAFTTGNAAFFETFVGSENLYDANWNPEAYVDLHRVTFDAGNVVDIVSGLLVNLDRRLADLEAR